MHAWLVEELTKEEDPVALEPTELHQVAVRRLARYMIVTLHTVYIYYAC